MQLAELTQPQDISVLLIEDSTSDATAITKALIYGESLYNFRIARRQTLAEGMSFLMNEPADVVLLDLNLPDAMDLTAIEEMRLAHPDLPIVIISGYSDITMIQRALKCGAQEFLVKGECSGIAIRQSIYQAIARKKIELSYHRGEKL